MSGVASVRDAASVVPKSSAVRAKQAFVIDSPGDFRDFCDMKQVITFGLALLLTLGACSREAAEPRAIRAHTAVKMGVPHAEPTGKAERYCATCHGADLRGGPAAEPSCYTCHGKTWPDGDGTQSPAPADHTAINKDYHHMPGLFSPEASCVSCHGASLEGDLTGGLTVPGCNLCHAKLWEAGAAAIKQGHAPPR